MRNALLLTAGLLSACAANASSETPVENGPLQPTPVHGVTPGHKCQATGTDRFIGRAGNSTTGAAIKHFTHAAVLRWAPPGYMLTMDYREDRVTVYLGPDRKVTSVKCG